MSNAPSNATEVLRGMRVEGAPLRLGRARAGVAPSPAAQTLVEEAAQEQALREACASAMREAHDEGLRCGRAEGLREGRAQAAEEVRQAVQRAVDEAGIQAQAERGRLQRIAQHTQAALADLLWAAQDEVVAVCFETLCRIVGATALQPEFIRAQLACVLEQHGAPEVVLHLHPQDAALLQAETTGKAVRLLADADVALGGCVLKTGSGALDARLESILEACRAALMEARAKATHDRRRGEGA